MKISIVVDFEDGEEIQLPGIPLGGEALCGSRVTREQYSKYLAAKLEPHIEQILLGRSLAKETKREVGV